MGLDQWTKCVQFKPMAVDSIEPSIEKKRQTLVEEIELIPDPYERLGYVVDYGRKAPELEAEYRTDPFKIEGCMSQLWVVPAFKEGRCYFRSDSDSAIVKGIAHLLCNFYSGQRPEAILTDDASFLAEVGITQHLSPNRRNGLSRITESIHRFAHSCLTAEG
jgi:cysteine desulfuration protein SufE